MSTKRLQVKHTVTHMNTPLAVVENLPGPGAELTPSALRRLANALLAAADECEVLFDSSRRLIPVHRDYPLDAAEALSRSGFAPPRGLWVELQIDDPAPATGA